MGNLRMRFILTFFLCAGLALAQEAAKPNVAITPFSGDNTVSTDQLEFITSKFTGELIRTNSFKVLDRGKMDFILQEQGFQQSGACNSSECKVQMGQMLGVDNLVAGKLVRFGSTYALHLEFIDVGTGEIAKTVDVEQKGDLEEVYKPLCNQAALNLQTEVQGKPVLTIASEPSPAEPVAEKNVVPQDAIPKAESKPMSTKRKVALALWGTSLAGAGAGYYFDGKTSGYADDYRTAITSQDASATKDAYDNTQSSKDLRNVSYGVSVGTVLVGAVLWFWPEGK